MDIQNQATIDPSFQLDSIDDAIADIKAGKIIIVVDDEDRENEGDFICAAECVTPEIINFMATHGRGLICTPITEERAEALELNPMVEKNTDLHKTAFTVSVDYTKKGCTTGISAYDRATGIQALIDPATKPQDFARPGHIFPLIAKAGGVLRRTGHTEAAIDLAQLAGFYPAGVLVEILNPDGTMSRLPQLMEIAQKFDLKIISIKDLVAWRMQRERIIEQEKSITIETQFGTFELLSFREKITDLRHLVVKKGHWEIDEPVLTRVHAGTNTAELFAFLLKNRANDLPKTLQLIEEAGKGALILLRYPDNGDMITETMNVLEAQKAEGEALNPFSKRHISYEQKDIGIGSQIIHELGIRKIKLITNNPKKRVGLIGYGLEIIENVSL